MINWVLGLWANKWIAFGLYWLPLVFCAFGYLMRTTRNFQRDRAARIKPGSSYYSPTDTLGTLIGRAILTVMPVGNLMAAIFDLSPEVFGKFFEWLSRVFNQPLVPDFPDGELRRKR